MASKRKEPTGGEAGPSAKKKASEGGLVNPKRWKVLHEGTASDGPVIYWWVAVGAPRSRAAARHWAARPRPKATGVGAVHSAWSRWLWRLSNTSIEAGRCS